MLPAYAGMILRIERENHQAVRAPRVCGDDPAFSCLAIHATMCSPRMRG